MRAPKYYVYVAAGPGRQRAGLTHHPMLDLAYLAQDGYTELASLTYPLPLWLASFVHEVVDAGLRDAGAASRQAAHKAMDRRLSRLFQTVRRELVRLGLPPPPRLERVRLSDGPALPGIPADEDLHALREVWSGRILFSQELAAAMRAARVEAAAPLLDLLQVMLLSDRGLRLPAVGRDRFGVLRCQRCGGTTALQVVDCLDCGYHQCPSCSECASMGEARGCQGLYALAGEAEAAEVAISDLRRNSRLVLPVALTPAQAAAASKVRAFVSGTRENIRECLVWAVCGAGKTEIVFGGIEEALRQGGSVLFAIPRREIVRELEPRLRAAFPDVPVTSFYGGKAAGCNEHGGCHAQAGYGQAQIALATTHQAIRFFRAFDLVVLDEVDAFPYRGSRMLPFVVGRARKERGRVIYLTATPDARLLQRVKRGDLAAVYIPARHHGFPLPEPVFVRASSAGKMREVALELIRAVLRSPMGQAPPAKAMPARVLVFVPTVALTAPVAAELQRGLGFPVEASHAADPHRDYKKDAFAAGNLRVLVATSIMERGITVPNLHVLVLFADHQVFNSQSLVQMAGRAGRSADYPYGLVRFIGGQETGEIRQAIRMIQKLNELAREAGCLRAGYLRGDGGVRENMAGKEAKGGEIFIPWRSADWRQGAADRR